MEKHAMNTIEHCDVTVTVLFALFRRVITVKILCDFDVLFNKLAVCNKEIICHCFEENNNSVESILISSDRF